MIEAGFVKGTINTSNENTCPFTIKVEAFEYLLDPINLSEDFSSDGEKVWVKFTPLRMKNRCTIANPVNVIEIQKRAD